MKLLNNIETSLKSTFSSQLKCIKLTLLGQSSHLRYCPFWNLELHHNLIIKRCLRRLREKCVSKFLLILTLSNVRLLNVPDQVPRH